MKPRPLGLSALLSLVATTLLSCSQPAPIASRSWDAKTAAAYLDYREGWWSQWSVSARDHGTFCVSCHTAMPYALSRPALRVALSEQGPSGNERKLIDDVTTRVRLWKNMGPYYSGEGYDPKSAESRGTESVLNALILSSYDSPNGIITADTRAAFDNMWALQQTAGESRGAWSWLQFDMEPWEANDSGYYGATLAAIAVGIAPENYRSSPEIQGNLKELREYLNRQSSRQSTINRTFLLWASTKLPELLSPKRQQAIINEILGKQQSDGGWRMASLAWRPNGWNLASLLNMWFKADGTPLEGKSDGAATGIVTLALQEAGVARDNAQLKRGLFWLNNNQDVNTGYWPASSVNKRRSPSSDIGRFMSDAATAYAVLALTESQRPTNSVASVPDR